MKYWLTLYWLFSLVSLAYSDSSFLSNFNLKSIWNSKHTFKNGDKIDLLVNTATSKFSNIAYAYYNLPFICPNSSKAKPVHLSLAEIINGDRYWQSDYNLVLGKDEPCLRICDRIMRTANIKKTIDIIKNDYIANWVIDGIPASTTFINDDGINPPKKYYIPGFSLGYEESGEYYLNNHLMMVVRYHKESANPDSYSIVGLEMYPKSVSDSHCPGASKNYDNLKLDPNADTQLVPFTYSVYWREEYEVNHNDRWKMYIDPNLFDQNGKLIDPSSLSSSSNKTIHWVSLINSFVILSFVSLIVAFVLISSFRANISKDSTSKFSQTAQNSFIQPSFLIILSILTGSGIQLIFTLLGSGLLSFLFFRNSFGQDTAILSLIIAVLIVGGFFAGFSSIQFYKLFNLSKSNLPLKKSFLISSLSGSVLISLSIIVIVIANSLVYDSDSPRSITFSTFLFAYMLYALFQIPISVIGGLVSRKLDILTKILTKVLPQNSSAFNTKTYSVPSTPPSPIKKSPSSSKSLTPPSISNQYLKPMSTPLYLRLPFSLLIFGFCPCSIVFIESRFLYTTLLIENYSTSTYMYGFIVSAAILLLFVMIEIGIISSYLKLLKTNSKINWQWWIFLTCSFSIWIYLVPLSIYHLIFKMKLVDAGSPVLYMVYTTILNTMISISCGSLALWSATIFIYAVTYSTGTKKD